MLSVIRFVRLVIRGRLTYRVSLDKKSTACIAAESQNVSI